jgi:hypothetical protein
MTHDAFNAELTCAQCARALTAYCSGALSEQEAAAVEWHAAHCAHCEAELEAATRLPPSLLSVDTPPELRGQLLQVVSASSSVASAAHRHRTKQENRTPLRWWRPTLLASALAAAVLIVVIWRPPQPELVDGEPTANASIDGVRTMARSQAASEFESLAAAAKEIDDALRAAPDDREMQSYRDAVQARRAELAERVEAAAL